MHVGSPCACAPRYVIMSCRPLLSTCACSLPGALLAGGRAGWGGRAVFSTAVGPKARWAGGQAGGGRADGRTVRRSGGRVDGRAGGQAGGRAVGPLGRRAVAPSGCRAVGGRCSAEMGRIHAGALSCAGRVARTARAELTWAVSMWWRLLRPVLHLHRPGVLALRTHRVGACASGARACGRSGKNKTTKLRGIPAGSSRCSPASSALVAHLPSLAEQRQ